MLRYGSLNFEALLRRNGWSVHRSWRRVPRYRMRLGS